MSANGGSGFLMGAMLAAGALDKLLAVESAGPVLTIRPLWPDGWCLPPRQYDAHLETRERHLRRERAVAERAAAEAARRERDAPIIARAEAKRRRRMERNLRASTPPPTALSMPTRRSRMSERCNKALAEIADAKGDAAAIYAALLRLEQSSGEVALASMAACLDRLAHAEAVNEHEFRQEPGIRAVKAAEFWQGRTEARRDAAVTVREFAKLPLRVIEAEAAGRSA
jgi:hypothetical protein